MKDARSQQFGKLLPRQTGLANERAERAFGQLWMIGHGQTAARSVSKDDVAAGWMVHRVAGAPESLDRVRAGTHGQAAHTGTSTISSVMAAGIGSPCFLRLARYPWMASRMLTIASSRVLPCDTHPGKAGHSATKTPSSSGCTLTRNFMQLKIAPSRVSCKDATGERDSVLECGSLLPLGGGWPRAKSAGGPAQSETSRHFRRLWERHSP